jgi:hypothetical protein
MDPSPPALVSLEEKALKVLSEFPMFDCVTQISTLPTTTGLQSVITLTEHNFYSHCSWQYVFL